METLVRTANPTIMRIATEIEIALNSMELSTRPCVITTIADVHLPQDEGIL
jgi:hypothetical protein